MWRNLTQRVSSTASIPSLTLRNTFLIILVLWLLSGSVASAQSCLVDAPRYNLREDTVSWSMTVVSGRNCIRGVRLSNTQFEGLKLTSPPQSGEVVLRGSGFIYSPRANFHGQDSFSIAVFGAVNRRRGSSTIQVTVSVAPGGTPATTRPSIIFGAVPAVTSPSITPSIAGDTTPPSAPFASPSDGATVSGWRTLKIGAGGYIRGIDIECDQGVGQCNNSGTTTKVIRTDTYGAYVWITSGNCSQNVSAPCWLQLLTNQALPSGDPMNTPYACWNTTFTTCGIYEIRIAPSNTNIAYMMLNGYVYKTTNLKSGSPTWSATGFARDTTSNPNDIYAQFGPKIAIDPANADIVIVCTESAGCFKTINGGMSFSAITGVTNATSVGMLVVFDPSSSVTGGATQGIYISSYGTGVYHSTNGGSSWTLTANTPTTHSFMTCTLDWSALLRR